jgi:hypothetical protein
MTIAVSDAAETLDAHLAFHLNAGVDFVLASASGAHDASDVLDRYERAGLLRRIDATGEPSDVHSARLAVAEHGADWVIPSRADEFWWPRGESLSDVLAVIPPRYGVVQGLVRTFAGRREGSFFAEEMTARTTLLTAGGEVVEPPERMLRPVYRAAPDLDVEWGDPTSGGRWVPLRAWYPLEVFRFPAGSGDAEGSSIGELVASRGFVMDTRLRDALRRLRNSSADSGTGGFALPGQRASRTTFPVPTIVDDASYAVECAAVGEVDLVRLDRHIRELEHRIAVLESRLWPRVRRTLRRLARRPS